MERIDSWSRKKYLVLTPPSRRVACMSERILRGTGAGIWKNSYRIVCAEAVVRRLRAGGLEVTAVLSWDGKRWCLAGIEAGGIPAGGIMGLRRSRGVPPHRSADPGYGHGGSVARKKSGFNPQTAFGEDILTRIFVAKKMQRSWRGYGRRRWKDFLDFFFPDRREQGITRSGTVPTW